MPPLRNLTGSRFGKLTVIKRAENLRGYVRWDCLCDCGNRTVVRSDSLIVGHTKSCGRCPNEVQHLPDGTTLLTLERKDGSQLTCVLGTDDYPLIKSYRWCAQRAAQTFYAVAHDRAAHGEPLLMMHALILPNPPAGYTVDHEDHNGLNNRRSNLRYAPRQMQNANRRAQRNSKSTYKGVRPKWKKFTARITVHGKGIFLGMFESEVDAARAYNKAALEHFGEFAVLNELPEDDLILNQVSSGS